MFTVKSQDARGRYPISIGTGKTYYARHLQEVVYALQHYYREPIAGYPFDYQKHIDHAKECDCCPLCRDK